MLSVNVPFLASLGNRSIKYVAGFVPVANLSPNAIYAVGATLRAPVQQSTSSDNTYPPAEPTESALAEISNSA